ncbi:MAG: transporter substrate-binding domain-containing protein [Spirochaetota bacterium]
MVPTTSTIPEPGLRSGSAIKLLSLLLLAALGSVQLGAQARLSEAERIWLAARQEIVFVGQASYPPFEFIHPRRGGYSGMAIELIRWMATEFGFNAAFLPMPFANAQKAVEDGEADALTGIFTSEERRKRFDFTQEVFAVPASIFVRTERTDVLETEDLTGMRIAVQRGDYAIEYLQTQGIQVSYLYTDDFPSALGLVASGDADALIGDEQIVIYYLYSSKLVDSIKKVAQPLYIGSDCMAVAKGNEILLSILDKGLTYAKTTGTFNRIYEKWLGTSYTTRLDRFDKWVMPLLVAFSVLMVMVLAAFAWTMQLNRVVRKKTAEMRDLNLELKDSNDRLTAANAQLIMDMEERARMEEERRRLEARMIKAQNYESLSLLAGGVAHDFNNLLTAIIGNIDAALDEGNPQMEARQHLADAIGTARQAGELAKRMLDFSGRTAASREPVNLIEMLMSMTKVLEAASPHRTPLRFQLEEQAVVVRGDPVQLRQVIVNLVLNAAESYESSGLLPRSERFVSIRVGAKVLDTAVAATIRAGNELPPGRYAFIEVVDRGSGIEMESMSRLFDPFYSTKKNGRGLGLAALGGIVQAHAGAIAVQSVPGQKTMFSVILPLATEGTAPATEPMTGPLGLRLKGSILLVEDQDGVRKTTARMLESLGLRVLQAKSSAIAAARLREKRENIHGILLDLTIGSQDSQADFSMVRELADRIPIIMTSGYGDAELRSLPSVGELAGVLKKPYDRPMLEGAILSCFPELGNAKT